MEGEKGGEASGHLGDVADFVRREGAAKQRFFAVGEPFFDDLVAADGEVPNGLGNVAPAGGIVQVDVQRVGCMARSGCCPMAT